MAGLGPTHLGVKCLLVEYLSLQFGPARSRAPKQVTTILNAAVAAPLLPVHAYSKSMVAWTCQHCGYTYRAFMLEGKGQPIVLAGDFAC
jgi:hypothetical protein